MLYSELSDKLEHLNIKDIPIGLSHLLSNNHIIYPVKIDLKKIKEYFVKYSNNKNINIKFINIDKIKGSTINEDKITFLTYQDTISKTFISIKIIKNDLKTITSLLLNDPSGLINFFDNELLDYSFRALYQKISSIVNQSQEIPNTSFKTLEDLTFKAINYDKVINLSFIINNLEFPISIYISDQLYTNILFSNKSKIDSFGFIFNNLTLSCSIEIGKAFLTMNSLNTINVNDLIVPKTIINTNNFSGSVSITLYNYQIAICDLKDSKMTIKNNQIVNQNFLKNKDAMNLIDENLSLPISIDMGTLTLTLKEILSLKNGSIIKTSILVNQFVDLCIQGQKIATGSIFKLDNTVCIKIDKIHKKLIK